MCSGFRKRVANCTLSGVRHSRGSTTTGPAALRLIMSKRPTPRASGHKCERSRLTKPVPGEVISLHLNLLIKDLAECFQVIPQNDPSD